MGLDCLDTDTEKIIAEAVETLESNLTEEDREELHDIYKDINSQILWKVLVGTSFSVLLEMVEDVVSDTTNMTKNKSIWYSVTDKDQELFECEDGKVTARRHLLLLMLLKKLLGAIKTRVKQSIEDVRILSPEEEDALTEITIEDLDILTQNSDLDKGSVVAEVDIAPEGDCRQHGRHVRTITRWIRKEDGLYSEMYCKDCRSIVQTIQKSHSNAKNFHSKKLCTHPQVKWILGQEGKRALCSTCQAEVKDPSTYRWAQAGLEPYGDNPNQDEAVTLQTY